MLSRGNSRAEETATRKSTSRDREVEGLTDLASTTSHLIGGICTFENFKLASYETFRLSLRPRLKVTSYFALVSTSVSSRSALFGRKTVELYGINLCEERVRVFLQ